MGRKSQSLISFTSALALVGICAVAAGCSHSSILAFGAPSSFFLLCHLPLSGCTSHYQLMTFSGASEGSLIPFSAPLPFYL